MSRRLIITIAFAVVILAGLALLFCLDSPNAWFLPKCVLFELTGFYCPGCGFTRSLHALLHGQPLLAWRQNCFMPFVILYALLAWLFPKYLLKWQYLAAIAGAALLFMVLRNIPCYPWTLLAPL